ncbi:MAG: hypothetical protein D6685_10930 [Bacteroidetes bacterium]|nr:MAG: hypothetical protein D6685_10930 [Bacteroidota bacterium]
MSQAGCYQFPICPVDDGQRAYCMIEWCTQEAQACFGGGGGGACSAVGTIQRCTLDCNNFENCEQQPVWGYGADAASAVQDCMNNQNTELLICNQPSGGCPDDNCNIGEPCQVQPGCPG